MTDTPHYKDIDILITGGTLLTMSDSMDIIENPVIGIRNGKILFVEKGGASQHRANEIIDASGSVIMPGLVNTHTHLPMVCFRGLADDLPLMDWLNNYIFPVEKKYVNRKMVYYGSMLAIAEMILSGTTTFCDGYFYESSVVRAAVEAGMRAVPCMGFSDFFTPDISDQSNNIRIAERFIEKWTGVSPLITPALFCHAPYTCSPETLCAVKEISKNEGVFYHIHLAETKDEIKTIQEKYGRTPVGHLHHLGILDENTVAVHCNWVDEEEIRILADCGTKVSHNPESSMKLAAGVAPAPKMMDAGVTVGLGTDGCASNNDLDLLLEMNTAAKIHKVMSMDPTVMDAKTMSKMATLDGAKVLGLEDEIGSIEAGKCADIIILDMNKPHLTPIYNVYSHIVYAASGSDVSTVIIDGKIVMKDRVLLNMDIQDIMKKVRKIAKKIKS
jgi:5-methylthioadenosine/S-adenosylhomocysteine deaminase